ncbi:hypothetical protein D3C77_596320 [compost metagenome]
MTVSISIVIGRKAFHLETIGQDSRQGVFAKGAKLRLIVLHMNNTLKNSILYSLTEGIVLGANPSIEQRLLNLVIIGQRHNILESRPVHTSAPATKTM